jgi:hypothetical protein
LWGPFVGSTYSDHRAGGFYGADHYHPRSEILRSYRVFAGLVVETAGGCVVCPHGALIPLNHAEKLPRVTARGHYYCETCEAQRAAGREQDERVKAWVKTLPRPSVPVRRPKRKAA